MASRWYASDTDDDELFSTVAAAERTALAWERSGFSIAAIGALLFHAGEKADSRFEILAGGLTLLLALAVVGVLAPLRYRYVVRALQRGDTPVVVAPLVGLVAMIGLFCAVAALIIVR